MVFPAGFLPRARRRHCPSLPQTFEPGRFHVSETCECGNKGCTDLFIEKVKIGLAFVFDIAFSFITLTTLTLTISVISPSSIILPFLSLIIVVIFIKCEVTFLCDFFPIYAELATFN